MVPVAEPHHHMPPLITYFYILYHANTVHRSIKVHKNYKNQSQLGLWKTSFRVGFDLPHPQSIWSRDGCESRPGHQNETRSPHAHFEGVGLDPMSYHGPLMNNFFKVYIYKF